MFSGLFQTHHLRVNNGVENDNMVNQEQENLVDVGRNKEVDIDPDGFHKALKPIRVRVTNTKDTRFDNSFQTLLQHVVDEEVVEIAQGDQGRFTSEARHGEETFPIQNGFTLVLERPGSQ